jgi:phosphoribosylamine--glycine ligase
MNVLILGSGGREHAFAYQIKKSLLLQKLYIAPGNAGTANVGENINIDINDFEAVKNLVLMHQIDLLIVGPEEPLVNGIRDFFEAIPALKYLRIIGPSKAGAQLEGSKDFSKQFMERYGIPTAKYQTFTKNDTDKAIQFLKTLNAPYVLKADGLAAGKGVIIANTFDEAAASVVDMLTNEKFGAASAKVVIEEFLDGIELSVFVLTDGNSYKILPEAKDYKRISENDTGLNTGGMGAVSPVPFADAAFMEKVQQQCIIPTINGLKKDGISYIGFVFIGLMNVKGNPYMIEYNCRMGDPETEVVLPRIQNDLLQLLWAAADGKLENEKLNISTQVAATVMMVSGGYPEKYEKGFEIYGLNEPTNSLVFHAGTAIENEKIVTNGGRVLAITSMANNIPAAFEISYQSIKNITYQNSYCRMDLGKDLLQYLQ